MRFKRENVVSKETYHTASEWHSLKSNASKLIIFGHISYNTLYEAHLKDKRLQGSYEKEGEEKIYVRFKRENVVSKETLLLQSDIHKNVWDEREKVVSKETYHFFRVTFTKLHCIKMNHVWTQISYNTLYEAHLKNKVCLCQNAMKSQALYQKSQKLLSSWAHCAPHAKGSGAITYRLTIELEWKAFECSE